MFSPDGNLVDGIVFGEQTADISEGRFPDSGPAPFYAMSTPTPRLANVLDTGGENRPPVITPVGDRHVVLGHTLTVPISASDPDAGQTLTYSLLQSPGGAGIGSSSGVFTWTPTLAQTPSVNTVEVRVVDNGSPQLSATRTFTVYVSPPPQVTIQVNPGGTGISLAFPAIAGKRYQVWYKNDLSDPAWTALGTPETATGNSLEINDTIGLLPHRFYRIEVLD